MPDIYIILIRKKKHKLTMYVDTKWMAEKYNYYNKLCFNGVCPPCKFKTNNRTDSWGLAICQFAPDYYSYLGYHAENYTIAMSNAWDSPEDSRINTLVHEMIHIMDYEYHLEHYIAKDRYGNVKQVKGYDAHGPVYFLKEAARLKKYGLDITKNVTDEEMAVSQLSPKISNREYVLVCIHWNRNSERGARQRDECFCLKTTLNTFQKSIQPIIFRHYGRPEEWKTAGMSKESTINYIEGYTTHSEKYQLVPSVRGFKGHYCSEEKWKNILDNIGDDKHLSIYLVYNTSEPTTPAKQIPEPTPEPELSEPEANLPKDGDKQSEIIPSFTLRLTDGRGKVFQNKTREELRQIIKKLFPSMKDETIEKLIDNPGNRKVAESRNTFGNLLNEVLEEQSFSDEDANPEELFRGQMFMRKDGTIEMCLA